jgi:hypothetical protein
MQCDLSQALQTYDKLNYKPILQVYHCDFFYRMILEIHIRRFIQGEAKEIVCGLV